MEAHKVKSKWSERSAWRLINNAKHASFNFLHQPFVTRLLCQMETPRLASRTSSGVLAARWIHPLNLLVIAADADEPRELHRYTFHPLCLQPPPYPVPPRFSSVTSTSSSGRASGSRVRRCNSTANKVAPARLDKWGSFVGFNANQRYSLNDLRNSTANLSRFVALQERDSWINGRITEYTDN